MDFAVFKYVSEQENLSGIFDYELNTFNSISEPKVTGNISLYDLLTQIKYKFLNGMSIDEYLTPKYIDGKPNQVFKDIKEKKKTVCYNATFNKYKDEKNLKAPTNLMFLDLDHFNSKEEALEFKKMIIKKYDWIVSCNLSISKLGLHIIILVDKIVDNKDFNRKYDTINHFYFESKLDISAKSLARHTIIPYDNQIYINENPKVLEIDSIVKEVFPLYQTGSVNLFNQSVNINPEVNTKPNTKKSTGGELKKNEIISSPHTFLSKSDIESLANDAARNTGLLFEEVIDESLFDDPNTPLQFPDGVYVMKLNLYPYKDIKVPMGRRNPTLGGISSCLIYLNSNKLQAKPDYKKKSDIIKFMQNLNLKICNPPLTMEEVSNIVDGNWKQYVRGRLNVNKYLKIRRVIWSKRSTLGANEKKSISGKLIHEPDVAESRKKISDAIESIHANNEKIIQDRVIIDYKIGSTTVKKYWSEYKSLVKELNLKLNCTTNSNVL